MMKLRFKTVMTNGAAGLALLAAGALVIPVGTAQVANLLGADTDQLDNCHQSIINQYNLPNKTVLKSTAASLNTDNIDDYLVRIETDTMCGSTGCVYELCTSLSNKQLQHTPLGVAAESLVPANAFTNGLRDLTQTSHNNSSRLQWEGDRYIIAH